jgi:hypothetical protein
LEDLKSKLADLDTQKTAIDRELASLKDHENYLAGLDEMAEHFVRDLPSWLEGWTEKSDPDPHLYRETYERFGYRIVANKDGTLDIMFGGSGEAHLPADTSGPNPCVLRTRPTRYGILGKRATPYLHLPALTCCRKGASPRGRSA